MLFSSAAMVLGFAADLIFGDPAVFPHPVVGIGKLIDFAEKVFRRIFPCTVLGENMAGACIWIFTAGLTTCIAAGILVLCYRVHAALGLAAETVMCWQILATKSLKKESMKVYDALEHGTLSDGRRAVSMIVGRDTAELSDEGVTKAAVETVAENTSDGIVAPLLFIALFGAAGGFFYKAVNTMDSMLGYVEPPYKNVGLVPAKMDDFANFVPARLAAIFMLAAGALLGMDAERGWQIFRRDRMKHASPNSAQTESVCAGLLGLQLAGNACYHGVLHEKPFIGDPVYEIEHEDIRRACSLMYGTAAVALAACCVLRAAMVLCIAALL